MAPSPPWLLHDNRGSELVILLSKKGSRHK